MMYFNLTESIVKYFEVQTFYIYIVNRMEKSIFIDLT
jgi:hypothetical protein